MAKKKIPILNEEQTKVNLFINSIELDKNLPKYKIMEKNEVKKDDATMSFNNFVTLDNKLEEISYESLKDYFEGNAQDNMIDFNLTLSNKMRHNIEKTTMTTNFPFSVRYDSSSSKSEKDTLWTTIKRAFQQKEYREARKTNNTEI